MKFIFPAHIYQNGDTVQLQTNEAHCKNTARRARAFLSSRGLANTGTLIGLLHDCGKYSDSFSDYIHRAAKGEPVRHGSVNHSSAGLKYLLEHCCSEADDAAALSAELLAYAVGAHHGLFDCVDERHQNGFTRRKELAKDFATVIERFYAYCASERELEALIGSSVPELTALIRQLTALPSPDAAAADANDEYFFYIGLLTRLLLSALIDADRTDTAEFMLERSFPLQPEDMRPLWSACLSRVEQKLDQLPASTPIEQARRSFSDQCAAGAAAEERPAGVFRLSLPTGGGKTLTGLRYALTHAAKWNKRRIIFTTPLLSILDQNAKVIRDFVPDDSLILEHHSNVINTDETNDLDFLTETWSAPIILTTLVQLLNTLFSGKTGAIRRFHALADAVIVIDEVQTVPVNMLTLFNLAVNFLSELCGTAVVLCSATQPPFHLLDHPLRYEPTELVPFQKEQWKTFKRTELRFGGDLQQEELPELTIELLAEADSVLIVCNRKDEPKTLFQTLSSRGIRCFHLSAAMCVQHRRDTLAAMKKEMEKPGGKLVCVSTQVIEAGVDISFERVIRLTAGMDSMVQAAGRCNRNGESPTPTPVLIVTCPDEDLSQLPDIQRGKKATLDLRNAYHHDPARFDHDLSSDRAIEWYYRNFYSQMDDHEQSYAIKSRGLNLFDLLAQNTKYCQTSPNLMRQAFKTAGELFTVFADDTETVIVPYGEGRKIQECLIAQDREPCVNYAQLQELLTQSRPFTVSLRQYQIKKLDEQGALIHLFNDSVLLLTDANYNNDIGAVDELLLMEV